MFSLRPGSVAEDIDMTESGIQGIVVPPRADDGIEGEMLVYNGEGRLIGSADIVGTQLASGYLT